jgi:hypothetical protein
MKRHRPPRHLDRLIRSVKDEFELPAGLTDRVQRAVAATRPETAPRPPARARQLAYGAAVLVVCAVVAVAVFGRPGMSRKGQPPAPAPTRGTGLSRAEPRDFQPVPAPQGAAKTDGHGQPNAIRVAGRHNDTAAGRLTTAEVAPQPAPANHVDQQLLAVVAVQQPAKAGAGRALAVGDRLPAGSVLRTGTGGRLTVVTRHGSEFTLDAKSELALSADGRSGTLQRGRVYCRNRQHEFAMIATAAGRIELLGTVVDAAVKDAHEVAVTVVEGKVRLANAHGQAVVHAGRRALLVAQLAPDDGELVNTAAETAWYDGRGSILSDFGEVAYSVQRADGLLMEAWAMNADGSGKHRLRSYVGSYSWADRWLPGERRLWLQVASPIWTMPDYATRTATGNRGGSMFDEWLQTWLLDAATAQDAPFVLPAGFGPRSDTALSPDGRRLAFTGVRRTGPNEFTDYEAGVWTYDLETGDVAKLLDGGWDQPAWSPDGRAIAVSESHGSDENNRLALIRVSDGKVTDLGLRGVTPTFSPDGTRLAYVDDYQKDYGDHWWASNLGHAYVLDLVHGGAPRPISPATERVSRPRWSPDGTRLLLGLTRAVPGGDFDLRDKLCVAAADGSSFADVYSPRDGRTGMADWAPSGDDILMRTEKGLIMLAADGSGVVAELGGTKADSHLSGPEAEQSAAVAAAVNEAVFQYAVGKVREFQGRTAEALAAYRAAAELFEGLPWRYPLADLSTGNVLGYADELYRLAGRAPEAMQTATCKAHLNELGLLLPWYAHEHGGAFPADLSALGPWAAQDRPGSPPSVNEWPIGHPDVIPAMVKCPGGDSYVYTPPPPGQAPKVGDTLLACPQHPEFSIVWERNDQGKLEPRHLEGYSAGNAGPFDYEPPTERDGGR